ncbi:putative Mg(2+) transport ATPase [Paraliobacillus sp. PM-2]|uniref:MgtC/SapB family protein n=1 Tax=Paraliobacillus sp. PM-2 TaxID=1462524 RepID=UPI00061C4898|nr:MgtC/SapB family protein [Paraliobacillus sp. PM-2]CQR48554.1 putative Mg(2+) transport ATPase [Paraliobacillus sp. PM-2]
MNGIEEFFDQEFVTMSTRIIIALILSGLIGFEREIKQHSAGFRTHILVGVSACLMMLLSIYGFTSYLNEYGDVVRFDPARIPSYVISGIGFLGAGTIIVNGMTIRGLTTAASIWAVAGLGLVVGVGMYKEAILTTIIILLSLIFLNNFEKRISKHKSLVSFQIVIDKKLELRHLFISIEKFHTKIRKLEINRDEEDEHVVFVEMEGRDSLDKTELYYSLLEVDFVKKVNEIQ